MNFATQPQKQPVESIVPMINVVFLLLIFFLMTAQIAPPDALEVSPPDALSDTPAEAELTLYVDKEGTVAFRDHRGEDAALYALELERITLCADGGCGLEGAVPPLRLRADAEVPATVVAQLLPKLAGLGFGQIELVTQSQ